MITNPYVNSDLSNLQDITILHNMIIQTHKDNFYNISQQITDGMSFSSEMLKNKPFPTLEEIQTDSLSDNPLRPLKTLKITKKSLSLGKPKNLIASTSYLVEKKKLKIKKLNYHFTKCVKWSPMEKFLFYRGLRLFGLDFVMINKIQLPHRSEKEINAYFRREDKRNSIRIDTSLEWFRTNSFYNKNTVDIELCSMHNLSNDASGECDECVNITKKMNLSLNEYPSLESVLEETKFLQI